MVLRGNNMRKRTRVPATCTTSYFDNDMPYIIRKMHANSDVDYCTMRAERAFLIVIGIQRV